MPPCLPAWVQLAGVGADGGATATVASPSLLQPTAAVVVVCWSLHPPLLPPSGGCTYETGGARVVEYQQQPVLRIRFRPDPNLFDRIWIRSNHPDPTKKCHKTRRKKTNKFNTYVRYRYFLKKISSTLKKKINKFWIPVKNKKCELNKIIWNLTKRILSMKFKKEGKI